MNINPHWRTWNDGCVPEMAETALAGDWTVLPILADALEEAGCIDLTDLKTLREYHSHNSIDIVNVWRILYQIHFATAPRFQRKVIKVDAASTLNVKLGLEQQAAGIEPTNEVVTPGILTFAEYQDRMEKWDEVRQAVGLRAEFPEQSTDEIRYDAEGRIKRRKK